MEVSFPHPEGILKLMLTSKGDKVNGNISLPKKTRGKFTWKGKNIPPS